MADGSAPGPAPRRPPRRAAVLVSLLFLAAALAAVLAALSGAWGAWSEAAASGVASWRVRPLPLAGAVACGAAALWVSGATWGTLFRSSGGEMDLSEAAAAWLGSNLGRYLPGKIWQVTGLVGYARVRGDSGAGALMTLLVFQAVILASGAGIGVAALGGAALGGVGVWPLVLGGVCVAGAVTPPVLRLVVRLGRRLLREPGDAAETPPGGRLVARALAGSLLAWALHGLGFWALLEGLVAENPVEPFVALGVFSASYVVGYAAVFAPGGVIVREGAMAGLLGAAAAVSLGPAAALALAARVWSTVAEVVALAAALALLRVARMRREPASR